jgi:site-specific DNA recombinase
VKTAVQPQTVRVAIYTRQSVASDLAFGSIDAQRESIEAYVQSQRGEGWVALPTRYDDHGFSGGNTERPAFQRLVADVQAGKLDVIATYKTDRVSRSLSDFTNFMSLLEKHGVGFVSTTQAFDTRTSMGRLTLNILASFSQFERETISERIADKLQASRRRGMWTGGRPILGYDVVDKRLVVNEPEAAQVREIYRLYLDSGSLRAVLAELKNRGWSNKDLRTQTGREIQGKAFSKSSLHRLLTNEIYAGQMRVRDGVVQGQHEPIIEAAVFAEVQERLRDNANHGGAHVRNKTNALLRGMVRCGRCSSPFLHTFTTRGNVRYRFYICSKAHNEGVASCPDTRVSAATLETFVAEQLSAIGRDPALVAQVCGSLPRVQMERRTELRDQRRAIDVERRRATARGDEAELQRIADKAGELDAEIALLDSTLATPAKVQAALASFVEVWRHLATPEQERTLRLLVAGITYHPETREIEIDLRDTGISTLPTLPTNP